MRGLGYTEAAIAEAVAAADGEGAAESDFVIWAENARTWSVWIEVCDVWRVGFSSVLGLDWPCVEATVRMMGMKMSPELYFDLKAMDRAVRAVQHEKKK